MTVRRRLAGFTVATGLLLAALAFDRRFDPYPQGFVGRYFANADWSPPIAATTLDAQPSTDALTAAWNGSPPDFFSTTWSGALVVNRNGIYRFATSSDDGAEVYIDDKLVVEDDGRHAARVVQGSVPLQAGMHAMFIRYFQAGGPFQFELQWARDSGALESISSWRLRRRRAASVWRVAPSVAGDLAITALEWTWTALLVLLAATFAVGWWQRLRDFLERNTDWATLRWIVAASALLNVVGVWWGVPARWAVIELGPEFVRQAESMHFVHGWFDWYPPLHFYVLAIA